MIPHARAPLKIEGVNVPYKLPTMLGYPYIFNEILSLEGIALLSSGVAYFIKQTIKTTNVKEGDPFQMSVLNKTILMDGTRKSIYHEIVWMAGKSKAFITEEYIIYNEDDIPDIVLAEMLKSKNNELPSSNG